MSGGGLEAGGHGPLSPSSYPRPPRPSLSVHPTLLPLPLPLPLPPTSEIQILMHGSSGHDREEAVNNAFKPEVRP